ncbi:MAG: hypothetical protein ACOC1O_01900 [bacterium]
MKNLKVGMKVKVNKNMKIIEDYQEEYIGQEGIIYNIRSIEHYPYSVKFENSNLRDEILDFNASELDILKNNIKKL